jgi:hypothetical protein
MNRVALIVDGETPVNAVVLAEGKPGNDWLKINPNAAEVTGLDPMPGVGNGWTYVNKKWIAPIPAAPTRDEVEQARFYAYQRDADPLFFQYQRGTATEQEWLDAVQAVKDANPYPEA